MANLRTNLVAALAAVLVMAIAVFALSRGDTATVPSSSGDAATAATASDAAGANTTVAPPVEAETADPAVPTFSDLPTVTVDELPVEAAETLALIAAGGPFPYRQDDGIFQNREGLLPDRPTGHYREYTVDTPGSSDRGARRIVAGNDGEQYWTDDHYDSFREIVG